MKIGLKVNVVMTALVLAACGGGSDSPSSVSASTPAPGSAGTPAAATPAAPSPAAPPAAQPPAAQPPAAPVGGPTTTVPTGDLTGGATDRTTSGYKDTLLTGRWAFDAGDDPEIRIGQCVDIPTFICTTPYSIKYTEYGFVANGLNASEIARIEVYSGAACASAQRSVMEVRRPILFKAADSLVGDATPGALPGGRIAVRQGEYSGDAAVVQIENGFVPPNCTVPGAPAPVDVNTGPVACTDTLSIRLAAVTGQPRLFKDEVSECRPGTAKPAAKFTDIWRQADGRVKR